MLTSSSAAFVFASHAVMLDCGFTCAGTLSFEPNSAPLPPDWANDADAYVFHYQHPRSSPRDVAFVFKVLVAGDAATAAASQLPDGTCSMCQLQISHYVRLDAQGEAVFSQEDALARAITSNICHALVPALKPAPVPEASPALDSAHPHRRDPSYPLPGLCEPPVWHPGYPMVPPAGGASDLYPTGPAFMPAQPGFGPGGMLLGPRNFPSPLGGPHFGVPAPGSGMPRFDPFSPPELHAQPHLPRNYGDAFAPPQPTNDLFPQPGAAMRPPFFGGGRGAGRGGGSMGPFGGGGFI